MHRHRALELRSKARQGFTLDTVPLRRGFFQQPEDRRALSPRSFSPDGCRKNLRNRNNSTVRRLQLTGAVARKAKKNKATDDMYRQADRNNYRLSVTIHLIFQAFRFTISVSEAFRPGLGIAEG